MKNQITSIKIDVAGVNRYAVLDEYRPYKAGTMETPPSYAKAFFHFEDADGNIDNDCFWKVNEPELWWIEDQLVCEYINNLNR